MLSFLWKCLQSVVALICSEKKFGRVQHGTWNQIVIWNVSAGQESSGYENEKHVFLQNSVDKGIWVTEFERLSEKKQQQNIPGHVMQAVSEIRSRKSIEKCVF